MNGRRRVAITGLGVVAPQGNDPGSVFDALCAGRSAIEPFDDNALVARCSFDPSPWFTRMQLAGTDRVSQFAVAAAESARADARWSQASPAFAPERAGVYVGTGFGGAAAVDQAYRRFLRGERVPPLSVVGAMANAPAAQIAMRAGIIGPVLTYSVACASSSVAIAAGAKDVAAGDIDVALVGGSEALLVPGMIAAWQAMQTLAMPRDGDPAASCRPFSASRNGLVLGEGAAFLVLEALDAARERGARIYAEIAGSGLSCDASHLTKPNADGQVQAMRAALASASLSPSDIGYCNAHGTATLVGDVVEAEAIARVWDGALSGLRVSSTKALHGHLLGAAGALEALVTTLAIHRRTLPPNAHCEDPDPACELLLLVDRAEHDPALTAAISNSFAFGGTNSVLAFRRVE
jgi:3-oxoacyl-[acyl-carrier-protein] synthase II